MAVHCKSFAAGALVALLASVMLLSPRVHASRLEVNDYLVNDDKSETTQRYPDIASDSAGNTVIVWEDFRSEVQEIYGQVYDESGNPVGDNFQATIGAESYYTGSPTVALHHDSGFVVAWQERPGSFYDSYVRFFGPQGEPLSAAINVDSNATSSTQTSVDVATDTTGRAIVVWADNRSVHTDIYLRPIHRTLGLGSIIAVNDDSATSSKFEPAISMHRSNGIVTWRDKRLDESWDVFWQRITDSYVLDGNNSPMHLAAGDGFSQTHPDVSYIDGIGGPHYVFVWSDERLGGHDTYGQLYQYPASPINGNIHIGETSDGQPPVVALDGDTTLFVAWRTFVGPTASKIYARRYGISGQPLGTEFQISHEDCTMHQDPELAASYDGTFTVVWADSRNGNSDIYLRRFDRDGNPLGDHTLVNDDGVVIEQDGPDIAMRENGKYVIVWHDERNGSGDDDIYMQRYYADGSLIDSNQLVHTNAPAATVQSTPAVALDTSTNMFLTVWRDDRNGGQDIYAEWHKFNGDPYGYDSLVNSSGHCTQPDVSIGAAGEQRVVVWRQGEDDESDIYAREYGCIGTIFLVNDDGGLSKQKTPAVAVHPNNKSFIITWADKRNGNWDIYAALHDESCLSPSNFLVNDDATSYAGSDPAIAIDDSGRFTIVWHDERNGTDYDIYGQRYEANGVPIGPNFRVNTDDGPHDEEYPDITMGPGGGFCVCWTDTRNGSVDVYAQNYDSSGFPLGSNYLVNNEDVPLSTQSRPAVAYYDGSLYFTWQDDRRAVGRHSDVYAKVIEWSGSCCDIRGDIDNSGALPIDVADLVYLVDYMFSGGPEPPCWDEGDVDGSGVPPIDIADLVFLVDYMFSGGPQPEC